MRIVDIVNGTNLKVKKISLSGLSALLDDFDGVNDGKTFLDEHHPYIKETGADQDSHVIFFTIHFIETLMERLMHEEPDDGDLWEMSKEEDALYIMYTDWANGATMYNENELVVEELDFWLVEEVCMRPHPPMTTHFDKDHKWYVIDGERLYPYDWKPETPEFDPVPKPDGPGEVPPQWLRPGGDRDKYKWIPGV